LPPFLTTPPFSRVPDITDFEIRQLTRLAKSMGFGGNVMELYAYLGLLTGAAREGLSREVAEYLTIDTVKAPPGSGGGDDGDGQWGKSRFVSRGV
jgi:hypothetical protein